MGERGHPVYGAFTRGWSRSVRKKDRSHCPVLTVRVAPGAERWAPSEEVIRALSCQISSPMTVEIWPRSELPRVWSRDHDGKPLTTKPYAFRAYSRAGKARLFVDDTETPSSALWLMLHEMAHLDLPHSRLVSRAYRTYPRRADYLTTDEGHEAHPEEQLANLVATQQMRSLGYRGPALDRLWWRRRVKSLA